MIFFLLIYPISWFNKANFDEATRRKKIDDLMQIEWKFYFNVTFERFMKL